jgi:uncharacterized membrane protein YccC
VLKNVGFREVIFSVNCFIAVMIVLFIAFRLDLKNPWWAMITIYLTSMPLSGALRARAIYRVLGTLLSGIAMLAIIPNLVDSPELATGAIILWVALCLYLSLLDRTPRSHALMLAGYTAALVGFPIVLDPGGAFDTAIARMEEIVLATMTAALVHSLIFPRSVLSVLNAKEMAILANARRWIAGGLAQEPAPSAEGERRAIASDLTELAILALSLPYDTSAQRPSRNVVRALDERLVALLPLLSTIEDRLALLRREAILPDRVAQLIADVSGWVTRTAAGNRKEAYELQRACVAALPDTSPQSGWSDLVTVSLLARLSELIESWQESLELAALTRDPSAVPDRRLRAIIDQQHPKLLHRDHGVALLSALTVACAMTVVCVFWIATAWPNGAVAAGLVAVICSLFAGLDNPGPIMLKFTVCVVLTIPVAALYQFAILPAIDGYTALVVCLAPAFIPIGIAIASPKYMFIGLPLAVGLTVQLAIQSSYKADMAAFLNSSTAVVFGSVVGVAVTQLIRSMGAQTAARRLVRAGWSDLADLADGNVEPTRAAWASRMLDRVGLLLPRLSLVPGHGELNRADALRDLRTGINIIGLQQVAASMSEHGRAVTARVLAGVAAHFRDLARARQQTPSPALLGDMDALIGDILALSSPSRRHKGVAATVGLRRNLYPDAPPYRQPASLEAIA